MYGKLLQGGCTCTEEVVVHCGFPQCSIEHKGGPVVTEGRVMEALQCRCFLLLSPWLSLPMDPCRGNLAP